jgi:hypothetical protein
MGVHEDDRSLGDLHQLEHESDEGDHGGEHVARTGSVHAHTVVVGTARAADLGAWDRLLP